MRSSLVPVVALICNTGLAQDITSQLPSCGQTCFGSDLGGCSALDVQCICSNSEFLSNFSCCVATTCSASDKKTTIDFATSLCSAQGISLPTSASCTASSSTAASTSSLSSAQTLSLSISSTVSKTTSTPSSTSSSSSATSTSSTSPPLPASSSSGLPMGSKIAIGVVIPVAFLFGIAILVFFWRRRKRGQIPEFEPADNSHQAPEVVRPDGTYGASPPLPAPYVFVKPELDGSGIPPRELQGVPGMSSGGVYPPDGYGHPYGQQYSQYPYGQQTYMQYPNGQQIGQPGPIEIGGVMTVAEMGRATPATRPPVH